MNVALFTAGCLALLGAGVHGLGGELLVVRRISPEILPPTAFGGARMTKAMIHVTWHLTTIAFLGVGCALLLSASVLQGDAARAASTLAAATATGFAAVALAVGIGHMRSPRSLLLHPGPALLTATAALAWWGALS
jgi:hypothetical protein